MDVNSKSFLKPLIIVLISILVSTFPGRTSAQSFSETAKRRSQNAARTIEVITGMAEDETIPVELFKRAYAIAVFPDVVKMNLLFSQGMKGYGVISSRQTEGWSLPAYYRFGSSTFSAKIAGGKSFDLIILFMNKETVEWFQKGRLEFKDRLVGVAGPVGKLTPHADREISGMNVILYTLVDGKLKGMNIDSDLLNASLIDPDNNINKAIYRMKGREVLQGKASESTQAIPDVTAFPDLLNKIFPVAK
jgi:lipid-binding SYLF domain-containing protein